MNSYACIAGTNQGVPSQLMVALSTMMPRRHELNIGEKGTRSFEDVHITNIEPSLHCWNPCRTFGPIHNIHWDI